MPWYAVVAIICLIIGPFDALYVYIKASKRKEKREQEGTGNREEKGTGNRQQATGEPRGARTDERTGEPHEAHIDEETGNER